MVFGVIPIVAASSVLLAAQSGPTHHDVARFDVALTPEFGAWMRGGDREHRRDLDAESAELAAGAFSISDFLFLLSPSRPPDAREGGTLARRRAGRARHDLSLPIARVAIVRKGESIGIVVTLIAAGAWMPTVDER